ncbi:MAG: NAD(P)H-hydrate dehydratase [Actinobacteria bacterium]|nr:NAD(P)H-hydrate dehydratase [Actinomycetota bacterium]
MCLLPTAEPTVAVDADLLEQWPLPRPDDDDDKEARGRTLIVGGSRQVPGAVLLAGTAALRAGAGKLQVATSASVAAPLAVALPEARVVGVAEDDDGAVAGDAAPAVAEWASRAAAVVLGPGMGGPEAVRPILETVLDRYDQAGAGPILVLDAVAIGCLPSQKLARLLAPLGGRVVVTPNLTEMAIVRGCDPDELPQDLAGLASAVAADLGAVVALKGGVTYTAGPDGRCFADKAGNVGLATSGSGDVLAGVIGGLAARGADALQAAVWGVHVHALAGDRLAERIGPIGYLARELLDEVPPVLRQLEG